MVNVCVSLVAEMCICGFFACSAKERKKKKVVVSTEKIVVSEVSASAKSEFSLIDENLLKSRIYTIRGVKVMLDADLTRDLRV